LAVERKLAAQAQAFQQAAIDFGAFATDIFQMATTLPDQLQQATTGMFVMLVRTEMIRQLGNPLRQQRNLDFR
jgi:hypothetical protein